MLTKLTYSLLLILCLFRRIFGSAKAKIVPKTVLVVQLAWLGDMVCTTPMFRAIKTKYPNCRVIVLGMSRNKELLDYQPNVDRYIVWKDSFKYIKEQLKDEHIDFACCTSPHFLSLAYLFLLGIKSIAVPVIKGGYSPLETKSFRMLRSVALTSTHTMGQYAPREYLRLLEHIDIFSNDTKKELRYSEQAKKKVDDFLSKYSGTFIAISPSAGNKIKAWPTERFAQLATLLIEKGFTVFVIGSSADKEEINVAKAVNTRGLFSVDELKAFISRMQCFISVDTGPIYIAEAFDIPTIDIVGPMDENEQPPRGPMNKIVRTAAEPVIHIMNSRVYDTEKARKAVEDITVDTVIREFDTMNIK